MKDFKKCTKVWILQGRVKSITLKGIDGMEKIKSIMSHFRNANIEEIADIKVEELRDYKEGISDLPKSDVLKFILEDNSWIAVRPSGTEPKISFILDVMEKKRQKLIIS